MGRRIRRRTSVTLCLRVSRFTGWTRRPNGSMAEAPGRIPAKKTRGALLESSQVSTRIKPQTAWTCWVPQGSAGPEPRAIYATGNESHVRHGLPPGAAKFSHLSSPMTLRCFQMFLSFGVARGPVAATSFQSPGLLPAEGARYGGSDWREPGLRELFNMSPFQPMQLPY